GDGTATGKVARWGREGWDHLPRGNSGSRHDPHTDGQEGGPGRSGIQAAGRSGRHRRENVGAAGARYKGGGVVPQPSPHHCPPVPRGRADSGAVSVNGQAIYRADIFGLQRGQAQQGWYDRGDRIPGQEYL
ncbi:unnamed protein product, partial [Ectocarpus fasciculatus]